MPQLAINLLAAIAGLLILAALVLIGVDVYRSARTGPRWKRKLLAAGLMLLAMAGLPACNESGGGSGARPKEDPKVLAKMDLAETGPWKRITAVWAEAEEVISGKRGAYPFDEEGQRRMLAELGAAAGDVELLVTAGLLNGTEGTLLKDDLALLAAGVQAKRPTEMRMATCYEVTPVTPAANSLRRLKDRLPLLEWLAGEEKLRPVVMERVLQTVEKDVETLGRQDHLRGLAEAQRAEPAKVRDRAQAAAETIRAKLAGAAPPARQ